MNKDPKLRPLYLAQILYERTDEDHYLTTAELMEILEKEYGFKVHRQTIPADVAALRSFGMEIQEVMSSQKRYNLISREYDIAEIKLLIDAVESSKFITKKKSEELVAKLSKMAGRNQAEQLRRNISAEDRIKYDNESIYLIIDGINEAINAGYMNLDDYPFRKYSIKNEKTTHLSLTENELTQLNNHVFQSLRMSHVRDAFLFCCYTGLRFSDFSNMKDSCLTYEGEHVWLNIKMIKTNIQIKLPIDLLFGGKALAILQKYGTLERLNNIGSNSKVNIYLKRMSSECKINKVLHWHVSRHTFSVQLIEQGVPITTIQRLLGHTSVRTTQVYSEVTATTIVKDLTRIQNGVIGR